MFDGDVFSLDVKRCGSDGCCCCCCCGDVVVVVVVVVVVDVIVSVVVGVVVVYCYSFILFCFYCYFLHPLVVVY